MYIVGELYELIEDRLGDHLIYWLIVSCTKKKYRDEYKNILNLSTHQ